MLDKKIADALDRRYGPIETTFTITNTPEGGGPIKIRENWVGAKLPVRKLHAVRLLHGYVGRRFSPLPEDSEIDAITGDKPGWPVWGNVEIRGYDAVHSLRELGRISAVNYWEPYEEAMLSFQMNEGYFGETPSK